MNGPRETSDEGLTPETAELVDAYFQRVQSALPAGVREECGESMESLRAHVREELAGSEGTAADAARVLGSLGTPEVLAAQWEEAAREELPKAAKGGSRLSGRLLGLPYELRLPTPERIGARLWDPLNPHVFVPRLFGVGWTVNFASIAVRLGLVRPDDEDVPFGLVPRRWLAAALAVPLVLAAGLISLAAICQPTLPDFVPVHFSIAGMPDRFSPKARALVMPICMTALGAALAAWPWLRRRAPLMRVAAGAFATMIAAISLGSYGQQVASARGSVGIGILAAGLTAALVLPFALLVILSRVGRAMEQKRDRERNA